MRALGTYQLIRKIGTGGMAEVWSARRGSSLGGHKYVAIKILARHVADNPTYREMFIAEARLSLVLHHANIVTIFDVVEEEGECYMVMELVEGMTLSQLVRALAKRGERLPTEVAVYVVAELLRALAYAHGLETDQGSMVVHRDVSPQNVMVSTSGEVKLMDFGIARFSTEETSGNLVKGKLQYMPPEQLSKRTRHATIDLFAVGGVLQELLEGKRFRGGLDQEVLLGMVFRGEVPEPSVEIPPELDAVRLSLLEPDPDKRLATAKEALSLLYDWPGYRNASLALEEIVRQFVEPASATSLPDGAIEPDLGTPAQSSSQLRPMAPPPDADATVVQAKEPSYRGPRPLPPPRGLPSGPVTGPHAAVNPSGSYAAVNPSGPYAAVNPSGPHAAVQPNTGPHAAMNPPALDVDDIESMTTHKFGEVSREELELDDEPEPVAARSSAKTLIAVVVGLLLVLMGIGIWQAVSAEDEGEGDEAKVAAQSTTETPAASAGATSPEASSAESAGAVEPTPAAGDTGAAEPPTLDTGTDSDTDAQPVDEVESGEEPVAKTSTKKSKKAKPKVSVSFRAGDFYFVYVKVAGRTLTLEPTVKVKLPIGTHTVSMRQKTSGSWKKAGTITLERNASYVVDMTKPAGLKFRKN